VEEWAHSFCAAVKWLSELKNVVKCSVIPWSMPAISFSGNVPLLNVPLLNMPTQRPGMSLDVISFTRPFPC